MSTFRISEVLTGSGTPIRIGENPGVSFLKGLESCGVSLFELT
ncbi:MAG: hypothetical protein ABSH41_31725 [Syntrophobacteraceae bacterium]